MQKQKKSKRINCLGYGRVRPRAEGLRQRLSLLKHANVVGGASAVALGLLALALVSPGVTDSANAEDSATATTTLNITSEPLMSIGLDAAVNMDFVATSSGELKAANAKLKVTSNNPDGYKIMLSTTDGTVDITNSETGGTIKGLTTATNTTDFPDNSWGYSLAKLGEDTNVYNQVPSTSTQVKYVSGNGTVPTGADDYNLSFAAKVNSGLPAGTYSKQITVSVVANPIELNSLQHLTYMQDMTSEICTKTRGSNGETTITPGNEPSKQLTDTRGGKQYWVSKLADGNCWMVQNLALDIPEVPDTNFTNQSDNISAGWKPSAGTKTGNLDLSGTSSSDYTSSYSWNLGRYVLATPSGVSCDAKATTESAYEDGWNSVRPNQSLSQCQNVVDVSSSNWQPTFIATTGSWAKPNGQVDGVDKYQADLPLTGEKIDILVAVKCSIQKSDGTCDVSAGGEYDPHYLLGNYYQWNTATAGSGAGTGENSNAPSSICPKGWQLPASGEANNTTSGSFYGLLEKYGVQNKVSNEKGNITTEPLYFVRSGIATSNTNSLRFTGDRGFYWSNTIASTSLAYSLLFDSVNTYTSSSDNRWLGVSVRCLAR